MRLFRPCLALTSALLLALPGAAAARTSDDTPEEIAKELSEKIAKAYKKAAEAQRKAAEKAAKRAKEEREDVTEAQQEAREKAAKERRKASRKDAEAHKDVGKLEAEALDELEDNVESYVKKVHKKAAKGIPALPPQATPEQMTAHQTALADAIRALRPQARQGDFFVPECVPIVKRIIAAELAGRAGAGARKEILNGNPPIDPDRDDRMQVKVAVNVSYPAAAAVSSVPPSVLLTLPLLEKEVEYRFVNRDLVLRDVDANLILDFIRLAAPPLVAATPAKR
jgi:Skp family chaperone for outer membrane proteins